MSMSKLLVAALPVPLILVAAQGARAGEPVREEIPASRQVHVLVDRNVVLKPKFRGLAAMTGAGERWIIEAGEYVPSQGLTIDGRRYLLVPYSVRYWDGRKAQGGRATNSFGCASRFQDFVVLDYETGELMPRTWKNADHYCDRANIKHEGKWVDEFEIEAKGSFRVVDPSASANRH